MRTQATHEPVPVAPVVPDPVPVAQPTPCGGIFGDRPSRPPPVVEFLGTRPADPPVVEFLK